MKIAHSLIRDGRKRQLQLPAAWCARHGITAGHPVNVLVQTDNQPDRLCLPTRRGGRGLRLTLPAWWCRHHGVGPGDSVLLFEREPGVLELQVIEAASEKELRRRGEVVLRMRIEQARAELKATREAGYHEGKAQGYAQGYFDSIRQRADVPLRPRKHRHRSARL